MSFACKNDEAPFIEHENKPIRVKVLHKRFRNGVLTTHAFRAFRFVFLHFIVERHDSAATVSHPQEPLARSPFY